MSYNSTFIPSSFHYVLNTENIRIPLSIQHDSPEERKISIKNYNLLTEYKFDKIKLPYVICDGLDSSTLKINNDLDLTFTSYKRQKILMPYEDSLKILMGNCKKLLYDDLATDFEKFPPNPAAYIFEATILALDSNPKDIKDYFLEIGANEQATDIAMNLCSQYNKYYLYFYLTRLYTYPFGPKKQELAIARPSANENVKYLIDILMEYNECILEKLPKLSKIENLITDEDVITVSIPKPNWMKWANEYINIENGGILVPRKKVGDIFLLANKTKVSQVYEELITWSDKLIYEIFGTDEKKCVFEQSFTEDIDPKTKILPNPLLFRSRSSWIMHLSIELCEEIPIAEPNISNPF